MRMSSEKHVRSITFFIFWCCFIKFFMRFCPPFISFERNSYRVIIFYWLFGASSFAFQLNAWWLLRCKWQGNFLFEGRGILVEFSRQNSNLIPPPKSYFTFCSSPKTKLLKSFKSFCLSPSEHKINPRNRIAHRNLLAFTFKVIIFPQLPFCFTWLFMGQ